MASKINSRLKSEKARSGKPYDRPKQSLLGKVASAVKNVLVPSWFLNVPSWGNSSEEETVPAPTSVEPEDQDEVTEPVSETCTSKPAKRLRYAPDNSEVTDVTRPRQGTFFPPSIMNDSLSARVEHETPQVTQNCELEKKEPQLIVNGDDHSENSEGTASTSGCSSLISSHVDKPDHHFSSIKLSENALENLRKELKAKSFLRQKKDVAVSTENSFSSPCSRSGSQADLSLWARDSSLSTRNMFRPQATFQGSRPSFNLSSFGGPSMANSPLAAKEKVSSPFYEGKTTYGGASAYRRAQLSSLPYQSSRTLHNKITVKPSNVREDSQCMSSAAKRILNTLEKMSTPLTDVKKIPNVRQSPADISASFTPASQRLNSCIPAPRRPVSASPYTKGLPVSSISTASRLNLMKNFSKISKNSKMEIPVHERSTMSLDYPTQSTVSDHETSKGGGGGGKIRTKINQHLHKSSKTNEAIEMPAEVHLPNIPLPITDLPEIKFTATEKPKISIPEENCKTPSPKESVSFTFANPLDKSPPTVAVQPQKTFSGPAFTFSSPIGNETHTTSVSSKVTPDKDKVENNVDKQKESELYTGSVNDFLKTLRDKNQKSAEKNKSEKESKTYSNTYRASKELLEPVDSGFGDKFKPQTGTWECSSCFVRNKPTADKCVCCSVSKSKPQESAEKQQLKTSFGFGDKFKPVPGSWECTSCLIRNKADDKKCVSCESENPNISKDAGQDTKFGSNVAKVEKPASNEIQNKTFSGFNFSTAGTWECDACLVRNPVGKSRCVACETPKLDPKSSSTGSKSNFTTPTGSTGFRFGSLVANPVSTAGSSPFLCTLSSETSKPQSSVTFGSTTLPVTTTEGFKFNPPTPVTSAESGGFKFGVTVPDASLKPSEGLFKIESPALKTDNKGFNSNNNSTPAPCFTFGNLNSNQKATNDHSKTVNTEISEETEHKTEIETVPKSSILASVAPTVQLLPKPSPQFPSNTSSITSISNTQCGSNTITTTVTTTTNTTTTTTTASSGIISSGFVFGSNSLQPQSTTTFPFGNKTDDVKTTSCTVSSAQTTTVFTNTAASGSVSLPSPFMFGSEPSKQLASSETAPVKIPADSSRGMTQETPVEPQSAAEVNSTKSLSFSSSTSQPTNFVFGTPNPPAAASSRSSLFKFSGSTASSTAESTPKSSGIFNFGVPATTEVKDPKPAFPFATATSEEKPQTLPQPQFTFSAFKQDSSNPVATSTSTATSSPFRFGATTTPAPSTGGFVFGTPKPDVSQTASSPFTFGTGVAAKPLSNSNFGAFSQNQPVTTATVPSFNFGMTTTNPAPVGGGFNVPSSNPSNLFTFGAKTSQSAPNPGNNTGSIANPGSVFGSPASQSVFSNSNPIPSFLKQPEQKQETPSGFSFGSSASSQTPVFRFGSNVPDGPQEKRRAAAPLPSGGGFNFAVPQPNAMNNNTMSFNPTTPPTFNFGAMPAGAPLFQFNASTESTSTPNTGPRKYRKAVRRNVRKPE